MLFKLVQICEFSDQILLHVKIAKSYETKPLTTDAKKKVRLLLTKLK
jgi:hypothetical protein